MKIALVRVPSIIDPTSSAVPISPPLGLAYLKASLKNIVKDIIVVDAIGNIPEIRKISIDSVGKFMVMGQTAEELAKEVPLDTEIIMISIMFSQDWPYAKKVLKELKKKLPNAVFIAGGEHITATPDFSIMSVQELDMCILGEGELVAEEVINRYLSGRKLPIDCCGTYVRLADNSIRKNPRQRRIADLDSIPWPDWEGFPLENYLSGGHSFGVNLGRTMPILASRGCPYQCTFCSSHGMWASAWKVRKPENVIDEMKAHIKKFQVENFDFYDQTIVVEKNWIVKFCELLIAEGLNITWQLPSGTRSEVIDRQVARFLYRSGCRNLSYAPESGSREMLGVIKKRINLNNMLISMRDSVKEGLNLKANIICGFPKERPGHLFSTYLLILKAGWVGIDDLSINQFSPYPGSELFESLIQEKKLSLDEKYFEHLSSYASMSKAHSYSEYLSNGDILFFKYVGTFSFYMVCFLRRPGKLIKTIMNVSKGKETTRLEKAILSYINRLKILPFLKK